MANALFDVACEKFLKAEINWLSDNIKCMLVSGVAYTPDFASHKVLADVPLAARLTPGKPLADRTVVNGAADAADVTFYTVPAGSVVTTVLLYVDTHDEFTSTLIAWIDSAVGLPVMSNGNDITIVWDDGPYKIFKL